MSMNLVTLLYLVASVCFIQALKGLSHPTTSRRGNLFGMIGMGIAVVTTLVTHVPVTTTLIEGYDYAALIARIDYVAALEIVAAIAIGAVIGVTTAWRIAMTAMFVSPAKAWLIKSSPVFRMKIVNSSANATSMR